MSKKVDKLNMKNQKAQDSEIDQPRNEEEVPAEDAEGTEAKQANDALYDDSVSESKSNQERASEDEADWVTDEGADEVDESIFSVSQEVDLDDSEGVSFAEDLQSFDDKESDDFGEDETMQPVRFNTERTSSRWWNRSSREEGSGDDLIGLTEAFDPVDDEFGETGRTFSEPIAPAYDEAALKVEEDEQIEQYREQRGEGAGSHAGGLSYKGDTEGEYPDAFDSLEPRVDEPSYFFDDASNGDNAVVSGRHGKRADKKDIPPHQRKSRRMRRILIGIVVLLFALTVALGYFVWQLMLESQQRSSQQVVVEQNDAARNSLQNDQDSVKDAGSQAVKTTDVPDLVELLGKSKAEAIVALERGAVETRALEINEEGNPIKTNVTVSLQKESSDPRSGTPTVYLGLNEEGNVIQAGYSAPASLLGYGSYSYADAIQNSHIIEKTLTEAGASVPEGTVTLPADKTSYTTYDSTGKRIEEEKCSFSGTYPLNGEQHPWSAVLLYDYSAQNASGNLVDVIRIVYVYVS